jgi:hypothetical protein
MFLHVYKNLNLIVPLEPGPLFDEDLMFRHFVSNKDSLHSLLKMNCIYFVACE